MEDDSQSNVQENATGTQSSKTLSETPTTPTRRSKRSTSSANVELNSQNLTATIGSHKLPETRTSSLLTNVSSPRRSRRVSEIAARNTISLTKHTPPDPSKSKEELQQIVTSSYTGTIEEPKGKLLWHSRATWFSREKPPAGAKRRYIYISLPSN